MTGKHSKIREQNELIEELHRDIAKFAQTGKEPPKMKEHFREAHGQQERVAQRGRDRVREPDSRG
jgi:hypothetical protein